MPSTTRTTLLLIATMALLIVGTSMATNLRLNQQLQLNRLLNEGGCATGAGATNDACSSSADCASGYCAGTSPGTSQCQASCVADTGAVPTGDDCSCCSGLQNDGNSFGHAACSASP